MSFYRKPHVALANRIAEDERFPEHVRVKARALLVLGGLGPRGEERDELFRRGREHERPKTRLFVMAAEAYADVARREAVREEALRLAETDEELRAWFYVLFSRVPAAGA